ncbi:MAG: hypothetical protein JRN15_12555 [Nitrososphaerota archaeon]|nr:hypothetical protein [Nitrososphaerota archaeon]
MVKSTVVITVMTVLGIAVGFVLQLLVAYLFGASQARDAYFAAIAIPNYIFLLVSGSLGLTFLPHIVKMKREEPVNFNEFVSNSLTILALILSVVALLNAVFARSIVDAVYSGFSQNERGLSSYLVTLLSPVILFQNLSFLLSAVYYSENKFIVPALSQIFTSGIAVVGVVFFARYLGIASLALGTGFGSGLFFLVEFALAGGLFSYRPRVKFDSRIGRWFVFSIPLLAGGIFSRSNTVIERMIASHMHLGSISYLGYSNQIVSLLSTIATQGLAITIFPLLSKAWVDGRLEDLHSYFHNGVKFVLFATIPLVVVFFFWGLPMVELIFERGAFTRLDAYEVYRTIQMSILSLIFLGVGGVTTKVFYATGSTTEIALISVFEIFVYIIASIFLSAYLSFLGLALANVLSTGTNILLSLALINRRFIKVEILELARYSMVVTGFAVLPVLGLGIIASVVGVGLHGDGAGLAKVGFALLSYLLLFYFTKSKTTEDLRRMFRQYVLSNK